MAPRKAINPITLWTERLLVVVVALNLALVLFDLSYVPWRNFWLQGNLQVAGLRFQIPLPQVTWRYDPIKGIEPHRDTEEYIRNVDLLDQALKTEPKSEAVKQQLTQLRSLSENLIDENPFAPAGKSGTLERIKNRIRDRQGVESARVAFNQFWSPETFTPDQWPEQLAFFNRDIRPLIETNYHRSIGENGEPIDRFWRLDLPFQLFFAAELLIHVYFIKLRHRSLSWRDALLWRWYDLLLFVPFWRWLRLLPLVVRLQTARLIDFDPLRKQFGRGFVALFAGELTEVIALQTISQLQQGIRQGRWLQSALSASRDPYVDLNNVNEIEAIARRLAHIIVYQVLPQIQPNFEALLNHSLQGSLHRLPAYQLLQNLPGFNLVPNRLTQQLASGVSQAITTVSQGTYSSLSINDPQASELLEALVEQFTSALVTALQDKDTLGEIQTLLCDFLEEFKINYIQRLSEFDFDALLEEAEQIGYAGAAQAATTPASAKSSTKSSTKSFLAKP